MRNFFVVGLVSCFLLIASSAFGQVTVYQDCSGNCANCPNNCKASPQITSLPPIAPSPVSNYPRCPGNCDGCRNRAVAAPPAVTYLQPPRVYIAPAPVTRYYAPYFYVPQTVYYSQPTYFLPRYQQSRGMKILGLPIIEFNREY